MGLDIRAEQLAAGLEPAAGWQPPAGEWPPRWDLPADTSPLRGLSWPPSTGQLDYMQKAITVTLLLLALPALVTLLVKRPERLMTGLARKHVG